MAYTVNQSTTGVQGALDSLIYVVNDSTNTGEPKYRYVCRVTVNGTAVIKLKQLPNNNSSAVFDVANIVQSYVYQDMNPYQLGLYDLDGTLSTTTIYGRNTEALNTVTLRFGYEYATTDNDPPVETLLPATDTEVVVVNGSFANATDSYPLPSSQANDYKLNASTKLLLSDIADYNGQHICIVADQEGIRSYGALAFLNGDDVGSTGSSYLHVTYYNESTQLNTGYLQNNATNGGWSPSTGGTDAQSLLYVGIHPANLQSQGITSNLKPSNNTGYTHYIAQFASSTTLSGNETSVPYKFVRTDCGKFWVAGSAYTLHWWNSKGGIDNIPCAGKSVERQDMRKEEYRTSGGNSFDANGTSTLYSKRSMEGGKRSTRVRTTTSLQLSIQTGNMNITTPLIQSLMNSERVYLSGSSKFGLNVDSATTGIVQVYVTDVQKDYLKSENEPIQSYTVNVELSRYRLN